MSSTPSSCSRERSRKLSARVTSRCRSSTVQRPSAQIATSCCARTSSGFRGIRVSSIWAARIRSNDDGRLDEVTAVLGEDLADARLSDLVAGAADALHARGNRRRSLDLDDEVDGAHVDAELEAARRHQGRQPSLLEVLFDLQPLLAGDAAVVRPHEVLAGQLVQAAAQPLGEAARVHEDQGGPMRADQLQQARVDARPDRALRLGTLGGVDLLVEPGHVIDRHDDLEVELLASAGIDDLDVAPDAAHEGRDRLERPLGRREADALRIGIGEVAEPFEAEGEMRAALRGGHRVHLVDDDVLDAAQDLARLAGEQEVERLRRRDEDVRRCPRELPSSVGRRVAGAAGDRDLRHGLPDPLGRAADPGQGRAQVALDVIGERLQRADVQDPRRLAAGGRLGHQPVEAPQEGGERLAAPGRGVDEGVVATADRGPPELLRAGRLGEGLGEPGARRLAEVGQGFGGGHGGSKSIGTTMIHPIPVRAASGFEVHLVTLRPGRPRAAP